MDSLQYILHNLPIRRWREVCTISWIWLLCFAILQLSLLPPVLNPIIVILCCKPAQVPLKMLFTCYQSWPRLPKNICVSKTWKLSTSISKPLWIFSSKSLPFSWNQMQLQFRAPYTSHFWIYLLSVYKWLLWFSTPQETLNLDWTGQFCEFLKKVREFYHNILPENVLERVKNRWWLFILSADASSSCTSSLRMLLSFFTTTTCAEICSSDYLPTDFALFTILSFDK